MADLYVQMIENRDTCPGCGQRVGPEVQYQVVEESGGEPLAGPFETRAEAKRFALDERGGRALVMLAHDGSRVATIRAGESGPHGQVIVGAAALDGNGA